MADVLSSGPEPGPGASAPRRRWRGIAVAVVVAAVAAALAVRSTGDRTDATPAPRTPALTPTQEPEFGLLPSEVVSVAVGAQWVYALVADCASAAIRACAYRLYRRDLAGIGWTGLSLHTEARGVANVLAEVDVTGADVVTVQFGPGNRRVLTSTDGGDTFTERQLATGPGIAAVPANGLLVTGTVSASGELTVLEPGTARLRRLATQPPLDRQTIRSYEQQGDAIWATASSPDGVLSAVSTDRGGHWRQLPVRGMDPGVEVLRVVAGPGGRAYLLTGTVADSRIRLTGVWEYANGWRKLPGPVPRTLRSALAGRRGLLIVDDDGDLWRLQPDGGFTELPDGTPEQPGLLVTGPSRVLVTVPPERPGRTVLISYDEGEHWRAEAVS